MLIDHVSEDTVWAFFIVAIAFCILLFEASKTIEFMFVGINMFWARLRIILALAVRQGLK